jgi:uncharacterized protein (DUF362 family)
MKNPLKFSELSRRRFLWNSAAFLSGIPLIGDSVLNADHLQKINDSTQTLLAGKGRPDAKVAVVSCPSYAGEVRGAMLRCFDLLGGIRTLVKGKTVTVKINLTMEGQRFLPMFNHTAGETYQTHFATVLALNSILFAEGARRIRVVESLRFRNPMEEVLEGAGYNVKQLMALGPTEFENTRNLGIKRQYTDLRVSNGGYLFSRFLVNHSYQDTDVFISLAKLKEHSSAGVTLSMKNLFGMTPNALYGEDAPNEGSILGRAALHGFRHRGPAHLPGEMASRLDSLRSRGIPRIVADLCGARPVDLAIIDGISSISGAEGFWEMSPMRFTKPGVLIAGLNPVSTDAISTAIMGFADPQAGQGTPPFEKCENHILLAAQAGYGIADLKRIEVCGMSIDEAIYPYA